MPCYDSRRDDEREKQQEYIDKLTRLLCEVMRQTENEGFPFPDEAIEWYEKHKAVDKKRSG